MGRVPPLCGGVEDLLVIGPLKVYETAVLPAWELTLLILVFSVSLQNRVLPAWEFTFAIYRVFRDLVRFQKQVFYLHGSSTLENNLIF